MWVEDVKTGYFCGCEYCPLCYSWANDQGDKIEDGVVKATRDALGGVEPTKLQVSQFRLGLERVHTVRVEFDGVYPVEGVGGATFEEVENVKGLQMALTAKQRAVQSAPPPRVVTVLLDQLDLSELDTRSKVAVELEQAAKLAAKREQMSAPRAKLIAEVRRLQQFVEAYNMQTDVELVPSYPGSVDQFGRPRR